MNEWELWRQDDNGARFRIRGYTDRVAAFAGLLVIESGMPHKQVYWVEGPRAPACPTLAAAADLIEVATAGREPSPAAFVAAFRHVGVSLRDEQRLAPDTIAAVFRAAWDTAVPDTDPAAATDVACGDTRLLLSRATAGLRAHEVDAVLRWPDLVGLVVAAPC
ncbi:hypothetical protein [Streptomyces sp. SID3343]|uniref:hypothetical protein n=1 Tax=Streptomyces sp. SID3343 TaxID=2690260 RepID=UPI0013C142FF|nr:hypothetical protein [Streptomyces sp. SID3343]MYW01195.1 hypothetical protein [Streptomyces sp. SID3343]